MNTICPLIPLSAASEPRPPLGVAGRRGRGPKPRRIRSYLAAPPLLFPATLSGRRRTEPDRGCRRGASLTTGLAGVRLGRVPSIVELDDPLERLALSVACGR